jgi:uncharacterized protein YnzC (UPF0291/DUF896 family)
LRRELTQVNCLSKKRCEQESLLIEFEQQNDILNQYIESIRGQFPNTGKQIANMKSNEAPKKVSNLRERVEALTVFYIFPSRFQLFLLAYKPHV